MQESGMGDISHLGSPLSLLREAQGTPAVRLIYTSCGLRATGFWRENRALQSCLRKKLLRLPAATRQAGNEKPF
jgi:hypothetical protein